jgi:hypothetical protein
MRFMQLFGFNVRPDRQVEFQRWVTENEARIRASYPAGSEYGGCYAAVFTSEKSAGEYFWIDILDSYAALDAQAADGKDPASDSVALNAEFVRFLDPDRSASWSKVLLKSVVDATILDMPTE